MSRPKNRNALLSGNGHQSHGSASTKDAILSMKYTMNKPAEAIYPLSNKLRAKTYPDYSPWMDKDPENSKLTMAECLNNGYFEPPLVANEYFSARSLIQETLLGSEASGQLFLQELSLNLTRAYKVRNEAINKITLESHGFKLPPRVTLTAMKRDAWLQDLANPEVPLSAVALKMPHGSRNKVLIDHLCLLKAPLSRAIWFVKCVLCSERLLLRKKFHLRQNLGSISTPGAGSGLLSLEIIEGRWLQEWTLQVSDYILRFSREMAMANTPEKKSAYQAKLLYLLRLVQMLYIELLIDRTYFLSSVLKSLRDGFHFGIENLPELLELAQTEACEELPVLAQYLADRPVNYGELLTSLTLVKTFWVDVLGHDILCKQLGEALLLNYFMVEKVLGVSSRTVNDRVYALPYPLKESLLGLISTSIVSLFRHNSNAFVVPDFWLLVGGILYRILAQSTITSNDKHQRKFEEVFRLINYRNESLMLNMRYTLKDDGKASKDASNALKNASSTVSFKQPTLNVISLGRSSEDTLVFVSRLDAMCLKSSLALSLRPSTQISGSGADKWRTNVKILIKWCTSAYRDMGPLHEKVSVLCNYIKKRVLQPMTSRGSVHLKAEFEGEILESIFSLAHEPRQSILMHSLYVMFNEFYQLKIISISSYLRKIIACGIFYISSVQSEDTDSQNDPQITFHLSLLSNLPALNNKQHYQILSKWTPNGKQISSSFDRGMEIASKHVLASLFCDKFPENFDDFLAEIALFGVGVQFLLLNWLTAQIKSTITQSPKLIHISPSTIARIYQFYAATNNLSVFFKVFVRFVLKNEDKVIIYYLDTLHYIGQLLQHHYMLVNFLPGASIDRISVAYELYNLIIYAYQDLTSREPDLYNFRPLWDFMNLSVDKRFPESVDPRRRTNDLALGKYVFSKESAESPLKVQVPTPRRNQAYCSEFFEDSLNQLLTVEPASASAEDIADYCKEIGSEEADILPENFLGVADFVPILGKLFRAWKSRSCGLNEANSCTFYKLYRVIMNANIEYKVHQEAASMVSLIVRDTPDENQRIQFLIEMIYYRIFLFSEVISILKDLELHDVSLRLILGDKLTRKTATSQVVVFQILQTEYRSENVEEIFYLIVHELKALSGLYYGDFFTSYSSAITEIMTFVIVNHTPFAIAVLCAELPPKITASLCYELLHIQDTFQEVSGLVQVAPLANEFSLPFLQLFLRVVTPIEHPNGAQIEDIVLQFLDNCEFSIETSNSFFGELFNYLEWGEKSRVFKYLETHFLTHREPLNLWENEDHVVEKGTVLLFAQKNRQGTDLLPVFKDFFEKFAVSTTESLGIQTEQFVQFSSFLTNLLSVVDNALVVKLYSQKLHDITSIFLRLLIIHSTSLTALIAKHDSVEFAFLKNMMALLTSAYLSNEQEKLRSLLFDLLLQMKGALTQALVVRPSADIMDSSQHTLGHSNFSPNKSASNEPSPIGAQLESPAGGATAVVAMSMILDLPEPDMGTYDFGEDDTSCLVTLSRDEIEYSSDVAAANDTRFVLTLKGEGGEPDEDPFNTVDPKFTKPFRIDSVGLIANTSAGTNNACMSLSMFDAYTTKENPY